MSKLDELIAELCPSGVEYYPLGDITSEINIGINPRKFFKLNPDNPEGYYVTVRELNGLQGVKEYEKTDKINLDAVRIINERAHIDIGDILFSNTGTVGKLALVVEAPYNWGVNEGIYVIKPIQERIDSRFLFYFLDSGNAYKDYSSKFTGSTLKHVTQKALAQVKVPVPPLEVQREIVRVLDNFTFLSAELSAELSARRKQYDFYRNQLLTFDTDVCRIPMGDLFDFKNGLSKGKEFFGRGTPFIRYTDVYNHRSLKRENIDALVECTPDELRKLKVSRGDVLFTITSETAEDAGWSSVMLDEMDECVFNGFTIKASPKTDLLWPEYCAYCFATDDFRAYVTKRCAFTTRASLTGSTIAEYKLAVPSIDVQKRIAEVLDKFETICNDLGIGLPAEIEARQKQYEYYRDKLLTFKEKA